MQWIDNIILGLVEEYGTRDVYELCDALEIEIRYVAPDNIVLHGQKAFYIRYFNNSEIIFISKVVKTYERDFILKHELGHAILHPHIYNSLNTNLVNGYKIEKQANYFACKLGNITLDELELREMTLEQISCCIDVPECVLKQLVNL